MKRDRKALKLWILRLFLPVLLLMVGGCQEREQGCTDSLASNFDASGIVNDGSCTYELVSARPVWSRQLDAVVVESSGLLMEKDFLLTLNDDTDTRLYRIDTASGEVAGSWLLENVVNTDWEDLAGDETYIYVGDFGNNTGRRIDLHVLRILRTSLEAGRPLIDTIAFSFADQNVASPTGFGVTDFDCEAMVVLDDSLVIFTKQWMSGESSIYMLPAKPGTYELEPRFRLPVGGMVTGAAIRTSDRSIVLCGYTSFYQPFLYLIYGLEGSNFKSAFQRRMLLSLPLHQVEGIAHVDGGTFMLSNEGSVGAIPQKIHQVELGEFLPAVKAGK